MGAFDQTIRAESFAIEENAGAHTERAIEAVIGASLFEGDGVDTEFADQACSNGAIRSGAVDQHGAAVEELQFAVEVELIALGVASEIVVIFEDEDFGV